MSAALEARLESLRRRGALADIAAHFGALLGRLASAHADAAALAGALASRAADEGHVCIDLSAAAGCAHFDDAWTAPPLAQWRTQLLAGGTAGCGGDMRPLVLEDDRLYLHRYWRYEERLAADLAMRAALRPRVDAIALAAGLERLFGPPRDDDLQRVAAERAVRCGLAVIAGGPGTGKTTTVAKVLALLLEQSPGAPPAIALAAPTGKAAARLQGALAATRATLGLPAPLQACLPREALTLHRLIGLGGPGSAPRRDAARPLGVDVLVIDEASMLDLALAARVAQALPPAARLILLGDQDQLDAVEPGNVFSGVCAGLPRENVVVLQRSHRFNAAGGIGRLAAAVRAGDAAGALAALERGTEGIDWHSQPDHGAAVDRAMAGYAPLFAAARTAAGAAACHAALGRFRVLCAVRGGPLGVDAINRGIVARLAARGEAAAGARHYPGQPLLVTRNDHALRLFNGDVGVVVQDPRSAGDLAVAFDDGQGGYRLLSVARLPAAEPVYAMTIHKSQGSEFDAALVLASGGRAEHASRELLYTGLTRVREQLTLMAPAQALEAMIRRRAVRDSGLEAKLRAR